MAVTFQQLNQLYLAYFGRPVDFNGFVFFTNNAASTQDTVAAAFAASPESQALFGGNAVAQVTAIYRNLFNRDPEVAGLTFWTGQIAKGVLSAPQAALVILNAAVGTDATSVANKLGAAQSFFNAMDTVTEINGYSGTAAAAAARTFLAGVTDVASTIPTQSAIDAALANTVAAGTNSQGQTIALTTGVDNVVGGSGNDTINGSLGNATATLTALDKIDGGAGSDTLNISDVGTGAATLIPAGVVISNIETLNVNSAQSVGVVGTAFDVSGQTGLTTMTVNSIGAAVVKAAATTNVTVSNVGSGAVGSVANVIGGKDVTIAVTPGAGGAGVVADGTAGALNITQASGGPITVGGTTAVAGTVTISDTNLQTNNISVDGGTTVAVTAASKTTFAGTTGSITIGATKAPTGNVTVSETVNGTGGTIGGNITITGGAVDTVGVTATQATLDGVATTTIGTVTVNGKSSTSSVAVTETPASTAVATAAAVVGVTTSDNVVFSAMTAGQSVTLGGLTFTATGAVTAAQAAAAFANLTSGALQGNSTLGTYTGTFGAFTTGAANGTAVVATSATANAVIADITSASVGATAPAVTNVTTGVAAKAAVAGTPGIIDGAVIINDVNYNTVTPGTITTVSINGYGSSTISDDALVNLSLANSAGAVLVNNHTATTMNLTVNKLGAGAALNLDNVAAKYTTLNVTTAGADSALNVTASVATALTVGGTNALDLSGSTLTALKTATISGAAGVTANVSALASFTDFNAAGTSGANTVTIDATKATYEGGTGVDKVTTSAGVSKAISLGDGNDQLTLAAGTTAVTAAVSGGNGTDTLVMVAADAVTASGSAAFATQVTGFEVLSLTGGTGAQLVHVDVLGNYNSVTTGGEANLGVLTMDGFTSGGTLTLTSDAVGSGAYVVSSAAFATPTTDAFNLVLTKAGALAAGTVTANKIETFTIAVNDTSKNAVADKSVDSLTLVADKAQTITLTGNAHLNLTVTGDKTLSSIDASAMTGAITVTAAGTVAETIKGGAANDFLTASAGSVADTLIGGAGNDTLTSNAGLDILTGGAGNDTFVITTPSTNVNSYATITDATAGDTIQMTTVGAITFQQSKVTLAPTAVFQDYANSVIAGTAQGNIAWFQFGGDTYVVQHEQVGGTAFLNGTDLIVKLAGLVDLSHTSLNTGTATLLIG